MKIIISLITLVLVSLQSVNARVLSDVPATAVEGDTVVLTGKKLDTSANPLVVVAKTADGTSTTLTPTSSSKTKVTVTLPFISGDTKIILNISGGNIPSSSPEQFVLLVLDRPNTVDTLAEGESSIPSTASGGLHASTADTAKTVTNASQPAITTLTGIATLGTSQSAVVVPGSLIVVGGISGAASSAAIVTNASQPNITTLAALTSAGTTGVNTVFNGRVNNLNITAPASPATLGLFAGSSLLTSGAFSTTLTSTAATNVTLPTTGILATLDGAEILTNKTFVAPVLGAATATSVTATTFTGALTGNVTGNVSGSAGTATTAASLLSGSNALSLAGNNTIALTTTGVTALTLPTTGTLVTLDGTETLTNKTFVAPVLGAATATSVTATTFTGALTGNVTGNLTGNVTGTASKALADVADLGATVDLNMATELSATSRNLVRVDDTGAATGTITTIAGGVVGQRLTIIFAGPIDITNNDGAVLNTVDIGVGVSFNTGDTLQVIFDGTSWYEISRSNN